jgi:hypothetical protein
MTVLSQAQLMDVLRRSVDEAYLEPLEGTVGDDLYQAIATMLARASSAVETSNQAAHLLPHSTQTAPPAAGGTSAVANLVVTRAAPTDGDIVMRAGELISVFLISLDAVTVAEADLEVATDTTLSAGSVGPFAVPVVAARGGYHANLGASIGRSLAFTSRTTKTLPAVVVSAGNLVTDSGLGDTFDEGSVGGWVRFTTGPNVGLGPRYIYAFDATTRTVTVDGPALVAGPAQGCEVVGLTELGLRATLAAPLAGGVSATLDGIGADRGVGRNVLEADTAYRQRVANLPDVVSPAAVKRAISRVLTPLGIPWRYVESLDAAAITGGAWDGPMAYDVPDAQNWLLGTEQFLWTGDGFEYRGFYLIVEYADLGNFAFCYDDHPPLTACPPMENAWDWAPYDGYALGFTDALDNVTDNVEAARAAGVPWLVQIVQLIP